MLEFRVLNDGPISPTVRTGKHEGVSWVYLHVPAGRMTPEQAETLATVLQAAAQKARKE